MKFNKSLLITLLTITLTSFGVYYFFYFKEESISQLKEKNKSQTNTSVCLNEDEIAYNSTSGENQKEQEMNRGYFATSPVKIFVTDKKNGAEKYNFQIDNNALGIFTLQLFKCQIYVTRIFNYDFKKGEPLTDYRTELWHYYYNGSGERILILFKKEGASDNYHQIFRIDPLERYLAILKKYLGSPDYALVIKDLKTLEDVFVLPMTEIEKNKLEIVGDLGLEGWSQDSRYFWVDTQYGANELGFIRIDSQDWSYELFPAPENVLGGDALNLENGYITVHPGNVWFGITEITEEEKAKRRKEGIGTELYIHNLFTGKRRFVDKTSEPLWFFKPKWISEDELEYEIPNGEKRIYKINWKIKR